MSADLETRLHEAFDARAETTTTSHDAWARIGRQAERHDHRRSVTLKVAAAAVLVVLAVGGAVALLGRDAGRDGRVASDSAASKSAAEDSTGAGALAPERSTEPFVPVAGGLEVRANADGSIVVRRDGVETPASPAGGLTAAAGDDGVVFGVAPMGAGSVRVSADAAAGVTQVTLATLAPPTDGFRTFAVGGFVGVVGPIRVEAGGETTIATGGGGGR